MASHSSLGHRENILVTALQTGPKGWCKQEAAFEKNSAFGMGVSPCSSLQALIRMDRQSLDPSEPLSPV